VRVAETKVFTCANVYIPTDTKPTHSATVLAAPKHTTKHTTLVYNVVCFGAASTVAECVGFVSVCLYV